MSLSNNWMKKKIDAAKLHQEVAFHQVNEKVFKRRQGRLVTLLDDKELIEFVSCSYLGLDMDPRVINAAADTIKKCGVTFPAARTRFKAQSFDILESLLNEIFCNSHSVIFASLHLAHLGILPLLGSGEMPSFPLRSGGPLFIMDHTVHASIQINRALLEQFGEVVLVDYANNLEQLEQLCRQAVKVNKTPIAIADSIGSMGGINPVAVLLDLVEKYEGYVYLDDAHGTSIHGDKGCGYVLQVTRNQFHPRLILAASLAKAFGAVGGILVLPSEADVEMVKQFAPSYVFGGPPPLAIIDSAIASARIHLSGEIKKLQNQLWENVKFFDQLSSSNSIVNKGLPSPIRGIKVGNELTAIEIVTKLYNCGIAVTTAMYPVVARGNSMIRIALSAVHDRQQIAYLYEALRECCDTNDAVSYARTKI